MTPGRLIAHALRSLRRRPLRNGLALTGVAIATATLVTLLALAGAARSDVLAGLESQPMVTTIQVTVATSRAGTAPRPIDGEAVRLVAGLRGVRDVSPLIVVPASLRLAESTPGGTVTGVRLPERAPFALLAGRFPLPGEDDALLLTPGGLRASGLRAQDATGRPVTVEFSANDGRAKRRFDGRVVGVIEQEIPGLALIPLATAEDAVAWMATGESSAARDLRLAQSAAAAVLFGGRLLGTDLATSRYSALWVQTQSIEDLLRVKQEIDALGYAAFSPEAVVASVEGIFRGINALLVAIAAAAFLLAGLGVVNALVASVAERTAEIGILKALGATDGVVALLIVIEGSVLGAAGGLLGVLIGWGGANAAAAIGQAAAGATVLALRPRPDPVVMTVALLAATLLAGIAAAVPALRAARMLPADALRSE